MFTIEGSTDWRDKNGMGIPWTTISHCFLAHIKSYIYKIKKEKKILKTKRKLAYKQKNIGNEWYIHKNNHRGQKWIQITFESGTPNVCLYYNIRTKRSENKSWTLLSRLVIGSGIDVVILKLFSMCYGIEQMNQYTGFSLWNKDD